MPVGMDATEDDASRRRSRVRGALTAAGRATNYIVSGASTPIKSSEREITDFVAVQRPRRKDCVSEPSTLC